MDDTHNLTTRFRDPFLEAAEMAEKLRSHPEWQFFCVCGGDLLEEILDGLCSQKIKHRVEGGPGNYRIFIKKD